MTPATCFATIVPCGIVIGGQVLAHAPVQCTFLSLSFFHV